MLPKAAAPPVFRISLPFVDIIMLFIELTAADSDVFKSIARSVWPNLVAKVTGVSPNAFLTCVEAPQRTKNLASSSFGDYPQQRCNAVSPLAFLTSNSAASFMMPLRNFINYMLLVFAA